MGIAKHSIRNVDEKILNDRIKYLRFIKGVAIYEDNSASLRRESKYEHNFSIVTNSGEFLMDETGGGISRFYHSVHVNEYGLFVLNSYNTFNPSNPSICTRIMDFQGNHTSCISNISRTIKMLSSRKVPEIEKLNPPKELMDNFTKSFSENKGIFFDTPVSTLEESMWDNLCNVYGVDAKPEVSKTSIDGLSYFHRTRRRNDREIDIGYVADKQGNEMTVHNFLRHILMLENGKLYRKKLLELLLSL